MIRRLIEAHYKRHRETATPAQVHFWLQEARSVPLVRELVKRYPEPSRTAAENRPLLALAISGDKPALAAALETEDRQEREVDRAYWKPLKAELEALQHSKRQD